MASPQAIEPSNEDRTISRDEIEARLQDRTLVIVNVMPPETFADEHIPGSVNLPVSEIANKARQVVSNLSQEIAIYCMAPT